MISVSYIVPTNGRATLARTLDSIECWPGDEIIVVGTPHPQVRAPYRPIRWLPCAPGHDWGHTERNQGIGVARNQYLAFMDDDDWYAPAARALMQTAITHTPDQLAIFRMRYPNGDILWRDPVLRCGNVSTQMIFIPNEPDRLGQWGSAYEGDWQFLQGCERAKGEIVWRPEVIAVLGRAAGRVS